MKKSLFSGLCVAATLALTSTAADASSILRYFDAYATVGDGVVGEALADLGETATGATHSDFSGIFAADEWDLLIIDVPGSGISGANQDLIIDYVENGGKAIMSHWTLSSAPDLASAFDVEVAESLGTTADVFIWDGMSPAAGALANGTDLIDNAGINGQTLNAINGAAAVAGFSPLPADDQAAIVVGNGGNTIVNGFLFWDMSPANTGASVDLVTAQIEMLLGDDMPAPIPLPASLPLLLAGMGGLAVLRRRQAAR